MRTLRTDVIAELVAEVALRCRLEMLELGEIPDAVSFSDGAGTALFRMLERLGVVSEDDDIPNSLDGLERFARQLADRLRGPTSESSNTETPHETFGFEVWSDELGYVNVRQGNQGICINPEQIELLYRWMKHPRPRT